jgi:hypothetical protein
MSRSTRRQKQEAQLRSPEDQFSTNLIAALRECAAGTWGLFGRNELLVGMSRSKNVDRLMEDGEEIERLRVELGLTEPFQPFKRFLEFRKMQSPNTLGEPKLAKQLLRELGMA